jgi:peptide/nickel transport system substrate-binding protein
MAVDLRRSSSRAGTVTALFAALGLLVTACTGGAGNAPSTGAAPSGTATGKAKTYIAGGTLTIRSVGDFRAFDPPTAADSTTNNLMSPSYATLLYLGSDNKLEGYLAKSWDASANSVTFTLKPGITCADGTPVTPTVVKNSFQRMFDIKSQYLPVLFGPGPYSTSADDSAGTFTFTVGSPFSDLVYAFTQTFPNSLTGIICPAGLADVSQLTDKMFGAGPYTLVEAVHGDHVTFKLRPEFTWGPYGVTAQTVGVPDTVIFKIIDDNTTAANALLTGAVDVGVVGGSDVDRLLNEASLTHYEQLSSYALQTLAFNESPGHIGTDTTIRRALITAIDPNGWLQGTVNGHGQTSSTFVAQSVNCYDPSTVNLVPKPSTDDARKVLTDAGWTFANGKLSKNGQPLSFSFMGSTAHNSGPEYLVKQWTEMGADVNLSVLDNTTFAQNLLNSNFDVSIITGVVVTPTIAAASKRISGPVPPQGTNYPQNNDPMLDSEAAAAQQVTGAESCTHWANFQQELWKAFHLRPLDTPYTEIFSRNFDMSQAVGVGTSSMVPILARRFQ